METMFIERREKLRKKFKSGVILIPGNGESPINYRDNCYEFIQDSTFLYYFGLNQPNFIGVIDIDKGEDIVFGTELTMDDIIWMGNQEGFSSQLKKYGVENFRDISELKEYLKGRDVLYTNQYRAENRECIATLLNMDYFEVEKKFSLNLVKAIIEQRSIKTEYEVKEIEKAVNITRQMHLTAMRKAKAGMKIYQLVAEIEKIAKESKATTSFKTICTTKGQVLHNNLYDDELKNGDLILLDCGAKIESGYCGDMTTVFPVSGNFTENQKNIYNILIKMFNKAEEIIAPGIYYRDIHLEVCKVLLKEFKKIEILRGNIEEMLEKGVYGVFLPHGLGHMMGLDVHDMENFGEDLVGYDDSIKRSKIFGLSALRMAKKLEKGHIVTVEPGIYFIPELIEKWRKEERFKEYIDYEKLESYQYFGGMRYEGDFLITNNSGVRLGEKMPKTYEEVENIMK